MATFSRSATPWIEQRLAADPQAESFHWEAVDGRRLSRGSSEFVLGVLRRWGRIDVLVNNMATGTDGLLALDPRGRHPSPDRHEPGSGHPLTRACLKGMLPQRSGSIVNIASVNALRGQAGVSVYSATKAGLIGLTKSLAVEVGPEGIRVNCVAPGYFESEMTSGFTDQQRPADRPPHAPAAAGHRRGRGGPVRYLRSRPRPRSSPDR